jgi:hypothetical protein
MEQKYDLNAILAKDPTTLTTDELNFVIDYEKNRRASVAKVMKLAKEKGLTAKKAAPSEKSPEVQLLATAFEAVLSANIEVVRKLFPVSADKPAGAKGVNISTAPECEFYIQILNRAAFRLDAENRKKEKDSLRADEPTEKTADLPL